MTTDDAPQPGLACWRCSTPLSARDVRQVGILRSRDERQGGPYRLYTCPVCHESNLVETTHAGRLFASPPVQPSLVDWLLGRLFPSTAETFLRAAEWYRTNEERRRYFFERDGDSRYAGGGLLGRLWSSGVRGPATEGAHRSGGREEETRRRDESSRRSGERARHGQTHGSSEGTSSGAGRDEARRETPREFFIRSPWEILGLERGANDEQIRAAFQRLARQYHPDKVHHLGVEFQAIATEKFKELQHAYELLIRRTRS